MKLRKWTAAAMAAVIMVAVSSTVMAATVPGAVYSDQQAKGTNKPAVQIQMELEKAGVKDVQPDYWAAGSITVLLESGLIAPDANGNVKPDAPMADADGIAVLAKVLGVAAKTDTPAEATEKARQAGLVSGEPIPDGGLSRLETARLLGRALGVEVRPVFVPVGFPFSDAFDGLSPEDRGILKALYDMGVFKGYPDRTFRPDNVLSVAELAILVDRILGAH